jgi:hypothetical protein
MKIKSTLIALALLPLASLAQTEAEIACDLERAKAEVMAATVEMPYVYGSVSNDPNNDGVTVGAGWSLSGWSRGKIIRETANAKCSALAATLQLDEQQRWVVASIIKTGAKTELIGMLEARRRADEQLEFLKQQLEARTVTVNEYNSARSALASIESRIDELKKILAQPTLPININNVRGLVETAKVNLARAEELDSKVKAESAWDVSAVVGGRTDLGGSGSGSSSSSLSGSTPFVGISFKWSFGSGSANAAVKTVREKSEQLFGAKQAGYVQSLDRLVAQISDSMKVDQERETFLQNQLRETSRLMSSIKSIDTALANNMKRTYVLQATVQQAELDGVRKRLGEYQLFMSKL